MLVLPAHAGVIPLDEKKIRKGKRITRTCGGDPNGAFYIGKWPEYYPHMRGWSCVCDWIFTRNHVLPAHAGVILESLALIFLSLCITRTCGGDPKRISRFSHWTMYYPHMRGWSYAVINSQIIINVLPAHAGVILTILISITREPCITRTCGGDPG